MSSTILRLKEEHFTEETTKYFLHDFENACETMELDSFAQLFLKYDMSFIEDFQGVFDLIAHAMTSWKNPGEETKILNVKIDYSKCLFCKEENAVRVYSWYYRHFNAVAPFNRVIYKSRIAFYLNYENKRIVEFGVCNGNK